MRALLLDLALPLLPGQEVTVHAHTAQQEGRVTALLALLHPRTGEVAKPRPRCAWVLTP